MGYLVPNTRSRNIIDTPPSRNKKHTCISRKKTQCTGNLLMLEGIPAGMGNFVSEIAYVLTHENTSPDWYMPKYKFPDCPKCGKEVEAFMKNDMWCHHCQEYVGPRTDK
eukprot:g66991.t1